MECLATPEYACTCRFWLASPSTLVSACKRVPLTPLIEIAPDVETEYCEIALPTSNVFEPARVTESEIGGPGGAAAIRAAQRPPQPVRGARSGIEVCH